MTNTNTDKSMNMALRVVNAHPSRRGEKWEEEAIKVAKAYLDMQEEYKALQIDYEEACADVVLLNGAVTTKRYIKMAQDNDVKWAETTDIE